MTVNSPYIKNFIDDAKGKVDDADILQATLTAIRSVKGCPKDFNMEQNCTLTCDHCWEYGLREKYGRGDKVGDGKEVWNG
jgi:hypothetical protein